MFSLGESSSNSSSFVFTVLFFSVYVHWQFEFR